MDPQRRMKFRRCLNSISNQLSRQNLEDMKFVCKDHVPVSKMERVRSALDLFQALEERGKMSFSDTAFLVQVLLSVGRSNLVPELQRAGFAPAIIPPQPAGGGGHLGRMSEESFQRPEFLFNEMLLKIAQHLSAKDVETLSYTWAEPLLQISIDRVTSGTHLFQLLQQRQLVTPTNLLMLFEELHTIGRSDLCKRINSYLAATGQRQYDYREAAGHVQPIPGINHTVTYPTEESRPSYPQRPPTSPPYPPSSASPDHRFTGYPPSESGQPISTPSDAGSSLTVVGASGNFFSSDLSSGLPSGSAHFSRAEVVKTAEQDVYSGGVVAPAMPPPAAGYMMPQSCSMFVPQQTYPIEPAIGLSVEERGGEEPSLQAGGQCNLTFAANEEEDEDEEARQGMSQMDLQDLQTRWMQSQEYLQAVELEKQQLQVQLAQLQEQNDRIEAEREGENEQQKVNNRELELALQTKIEEVQVLQDEIKLIQQNLQSTRPTPAANPDELYKLDKSPHGICLIINNHKFYHRDPNKAHPNRGGAEIDQYNLTQTFRYLRYRVEVEENLTSDLMTDKLMKMSQRDHSNYDSFVCCILSHGEHNIIHGANSEPVNLNDLTGIMKYCISLRNKPKLFFVQCCRGEEEDLGFEKDNPGDIGSFRSSIPREADFFFGFATPLGKAAYRSRKHGSWYISELCKVFTQYGYHSTLSSMMRRVNRQVSNAFTKDGYKQCTEFTDRLRKEVHFFFFIRRRGKPS